MFILKTSIIFLIFNRPDCTRHVFEQIRQAKPKRLFIVADGPRAGNNRDKSLCAETRDIVKDIDWECQVLRNYADTNLGCKRRVSSGITWAFEHVDEAIILEDDCLPAPSFFTFCATLLDYHRNDENVFQINGTCFLKNSNINESYFFSKYNHIWGWATWKRAWEHLEIENLNFDNDFELLNFYSDIEREYWYKIFSEYFSGKIDTWDYPWMFSMWKNKGLCIYPTKNMVKNIGFRDDATHTKTGSRFENMTLQNIGDLVHPPLISQNQQLDAENFEHVFLGKDNNSYKIDTIENKSKQKLLLEEGKKYLSEHNYSKALQIFSTIKSFNFEQEGVDYYRALSFYGKKDFISAKEALKEELRFFPDNKDAVEFSKRISNFDLLNNAQNTEIEFLLNLINNYTMIGKERLYSLYFLSKKICDLDIPGNFVECGVAAGGSSALIAFVIKKYSKRTRFLYSFDTFEGMPKPTTHDTHHNIPANDTGWGTGTCAANEHSLLKICEKIEVKDIVFPVKGFFKNTLPQHKQIIGDIAFLHMDGDWYESTQDILNNLYDQVSTHGYIQVDDYGYWDGCKKALHEFEVTRKINFCLHKIDGTGVWFQKIDTSCDTFSQPYQLLNLGCGKRYHSSWINIDFKSDCSEVTAHDLTKDIPIQSESINAVYHSHLLEHFPKDHALTFLKDCFRVLKPGGIIRVVVPDLENIARLYLILLEKSLKGDEEARKRYDWIMLELFDQMVRNQSGGEMLRYWRQNPMPTEEFVIERLGSEVKDAIVRFRSPHNNTHQPDRPHDIALDPLKIGQFRLSGEIHQWMFDRYSLGKLLEEAGFSDIMVCKANESQIANFNSYLLDIEADGSVRKPDSLFMEAKKPSTPSLISDNKTFLSIPRDSDHHISTLIKTNISNFSINKNHLKVVHLCTLDHGGAGVAALRLHLGLLAQGMNSNILVLHAKSGKPSVHSVTTKTGYQSQAAWKVAYDRWQKVLAGHSHRPLGLEFFTDTASDALVLDHPLFKQADIINLHWIPGLLDIQSMPEILSGKRVIWTLHDQNPFTGGCHYAGDCLKFQTFCHACPQLGSKNEKDLAFRQWQDKKMAYAAIDLEIVTPSKWLAEQAKASTLFAGRRICVIPNGLPVGLFQPRPTQDLRKNFGLSEDDFVLMFGAHAHTHRKGFAHLKQLLKVIPPRLQGKRVVAATFGHLDAGLPSRIPLLNFGFVAEPSRLAAFYSMADVYVTPAVEDNLPNTVMESMACGTPVVGFEIGGMPDMVRHGETGWLARLGDIDGLVQGAMWARKFGEKARKGIATLTRQYFNDRVQAKRYGRLFSEEPFSRNNEISLETPPSIPLCDPNHFEHFSYAKNNHFIAFSGMDLSLYGKPIAPQRSDLKRYQDTLILTFIAANIPAGARILEIGGGNSRILAHLAAQYECWNIDKFEGVGSGPKQAEQAGYKIVLDYMGNSNPELPDDYFDFIFSISALEHTPNDPELYASILRDITKALKPDGWSLHLFDVVFKPEGFWTNHFLPYLFENTSASYPMPDPEVMQEDQDIYFMSNDAYDKHWKKITGKSYEEFGLPTSINILWQKLSKTSKKNTHKYYPEFKKNNDIPKRPIIQTRRTRPLISIVTPSFNQAEFLEECIDSILSQNYLNLEYVIMDGGSTDGSVDIIKKYNKYLKYWQSKKDLGQYWAINEGFKHTTGEVMAWLNSDDKYHSQSLYKIANFFDSTPESEWVMGRPTVWNTQGELIHVVKEIPSWSQKLYLEGNYGPPHIQQESTFWKRSIWDKSGGYIDINLNYAGDMELWSRFFRHTNLHILDDLIGGFRTQPNSKTYISMDLYNKEADIIISREKKIYNYE